MTTSSIAPIVSGMQGTAKAAVKSLTEDGGAQFMQLLLAQLRNQNPLDPVQDKDFLGQVTQLNSFQELQKMTKLLQSLSKSNQLTEAAGLIGKTIRVRAADGQVRSGLVSGVTLTGDTAMLVMGQDQAALADVIGVSAGSA
jgi:flagellar basal-body rod modification protein FlgD